MQCDLDWVLNLVVSVSFSSTTFDPAWLLGSHKTGCVQDDLTRWSTSVVFLFYLELEYRLVNSIEMINYPGSGKAQVDVKQLI